MTHFFVSIHSLSSRSVLATVVSLIPLLAAAWVWFSSLSFVPVPWPDDSAFYFVARELFKWPPRWVMLPQAPFEPTYRIWNFNTMPLYPILLGLGRWIGIDGSWALKLWPLGFWAASGVVLSRSLLRAGLPLGFAFALTLAFAMDPTLRWASVLIRPESLIGLFGMILVLGLSLGWYEGEARAWYKDPVAWMLALSAYCHFNAIHLLFPVIVVFAFRPRRLIQIGLHTLTYLLPWLLTVAWHFELFKYQMDTQWGRLAVPNPWLSSVRSALQGLFQNMGSPDPWPAEIYWSSYFLWALILLAGVAWFFGMAKNLRQLLNRSKAPLREASSGSWPVAASAWVLSSFWLWQTKPEVWFTYYLHESLWCFAGVSILNLLLAQNRPKTAGSRRSLLRGGSLALTIGTGACALLFLIVNLRQENELDSTKSWNWSAYREFIDCIDRKLTAEEAKREARDSMHGSATPEPFRVWDPTFPDITIELSRRHPRWELTRTNDFYSRDSLAIRHGEEVEAVVVPETISRAENWIDAPQELHPDIQSVWMNWRGYYLHRLLEVRDWKPSRYLCQVGRWQAFIYLN